LLPNFWAYFVHCNNISVSVNTSVGEWTTSFTIDLLLSSNAFLARILDNEKAEILGSSEVKVGAIGVATAGFSTLLSVVGLTSVGGGITTGVPGTAVVEGFTTSVIE
jgi:hypothetical protein